MAVRILPDAGLLKQIFDYNPDTGEIFHRPRPREIFPTYCSFRTWNARYPGRNACCAAGGYYLVSFKNKQYLAHRVAYKIHYGVEPPDYLDHINCNGLDNRISNLRPATWGQNMMNRTARADNKTGAKGVRRDPRTGRFIARIRVNNREYHLGCFDTIPEAKAAYDAASIRLHGEFARA